MRWIRDYATTGFRISASYIRADLGDPHDLGHHVATEVDEAHHDFEPVHAPLGHAHMHTTRIDARIRAHRR